MKNQRALFPLPPHPPPILPSFLPSFSAVLSLRFFFFLPSPRVVQEGTERKRDRGKEKV